MLCGPVSAPDPEELAARYGGEAAVVRRAGRTYPAAVAPRDALRVVRVPGRVLTGLRAAGRPYLEASLRSHPWLHDGEVMSYVGLAGDELRLTPGRYFDRLAIGEAVRRDPEVRAFAERAASGRPLHDGRGRAAAPGVTTVATFAHGDGRAFVMGRRRGLPVADGVWHIVPAGTMDRTPPSVDPIVHTSHTELREELGLEPGDAPLRLLGVGWDLERLFPEVVVRIDLDADLGDVLAAAPLAEHDELVPVALTREAIAAYWLAHPPALLSPPGAAALALLEDSLHG